jgi:hypothetical protein
VTIFNPRRINVIVPFSISSGNLKSQRKDVYETITNICDEDGRRKTSQHHVLATFVDFKKKS